MSKIFLTFGFVVSNVSIWKKWNPQKRRIVLAWLDYFVFRHLGYIKSLGTFHDKELGFETVKKFSVCLFSYRAGIT